MAQYYVIMLNFPTLSSVPIKALEEVLDPCKDWLRFHPEAWIVYTDLSAGELRDRLRLKFDAEDPSILIVPTDLKSWAAYAKPTAREWIKKERPSELEGE